MLPFLFIFFFFFNDTATTEIYTLSLHDALPICDRYLRRHTRTRSWRGRLRHPPHYQRDQKGRPAGLRSEEHTSELQSHLNLVCRLLLEKKKKDARTVIETGWLQLPPQVHDICLN